MIYQGALRAETTLAGDRGRDRRRPRLPPPRPLRLRDPRLEARPPDRNGRYPRGRAPARNLRLALRAELRRAAGRAPGPQRRRRRSRTSPTRAASRRWRRSSGSSRIGLREQEPHVPVGWGKCCGLRLLRALLAARGRAPLGRPAAVERVGLIGELERRGVETIDQLLAELRRRDRSPRSSGPGARA